MPMFEKGDVRIHYEEAGSGYPLLIIPGGGLNSTVKGLETHPFNPLVEFKDQHRVIGEFMVLGFCIGGPFIWNMLKRARGRVTAAVLTQPSGFRPTMPDLFY